MWVKQADRGVGHGDGALTASEQEELARLRRVTDLGERGQQFVAPGPDGVYAVRRRNVAAADATPAPWACHRILAAHPGQRVSDKNHNIL